MKIVQDLKKSVARIEEKLDKIGDDQSQIRVVQAEQAADLKYHIKRTDQIEEQLLPLVEIKTKFDGMFLLIGKIGSGITLFFGAVKAIETIMSYL